MKEEKMYTYIIVSKINNLSKIVIAVDKFHALNKALWSYPDHSIFDLKILKKL
jgi:hypothetical protein